MEHLALADDNNQILSPLDTIPLMFGIGLNYKSHAEEAGVDISRFFHVEIHLLTMS